MSLQGKTLEIVRYWEFYDLPRQILGFDGATYWLLEGSFDDELDDYSPEFRVYALGERREQALERFGDQQWRSEAVVVCTIPVVDAEFDETRRKRVRLGCAKA